MTKYTLPVGVQDMLPDECYNLEIIQSKLKDKFLRAGCKPIAPAAINYYDTFSSSRGRVSQEEMFKSTDSDGKILVLRPDMTLAVSALAATKLGGEPVKLSYVAHSWNYVAMHGEKQREFLQAGVEFLGLDSPLSDAQTIAFAIECLKEINLDEFIIDIGHIGFFKALLAGSGLNEQQTEEIRRRINAKDDVGVQMLLNEYGASEKAGAAIMALPTLFGGVEVLDRARGLTSDKAALSALDHLKRVYQMLEGFGLGKYVSFDLGTVKSLSYYSGIVFTCLVKNYGSYILSGGRYDYLADDFGRHIPAVGFAMGLKRVLKVLERQGKLIKNDGTEYIILCEDGAESKAYAEYLRLLSLGKSAELFAGSADEGVKYAQGKRAKVLKACAGGIKEL